MGEARLDISNSATMFVPAPDGGPATGVAQPAWYVLKIRTGGEAAAAAALQYRGFAPYYPTQKERRRYSDRVKTVDAPVFPGYVFCQFDIDRKLPIISSPGVDYILGGPEGPTPVPDEELASVRRMIDNGATAASSLVPGQHVRVTHGPLAGVKGTLVHGVNGDQLVVSIQLLNRGACLHIKEDQVCPAGEDQ